MPTRPRSKKRGPAPLAPRRRLPVLHGGGEAPPAERADAARNRARILAAARELLRKKPLRDICMDEVARAADVGKGTLYRRFVDRSALCFALLDEGERALQAQVLDRFGLPAGAPPGVLLEALLEGLFAFALENADVLAEAEGSVGAGTPLHERAPYRWRHRALVRLATAAAAAAKAGEGTAAHGGVDVELAADLLLFAMSGAMVARHVRSERDGRALLERYRSLWRSLFPAAGRG